MIEGSQQGTATNANGEFIFPIDSGNYNIIFSFIGYERLVKKFNGNNSAEFREIQLAPAVETIEDVVVTGIPKKKRELHGIGKHVQGRRLESRRYAKCTSKYQDTGPLFQD